MWKILKRGGLRPDRTATVVLALATVHNHIIDFRLDRDWGDFDPGCDYEDPDTFDTTPKSTESDKETSSALGKILRDRLVAACVDTDQLHF